MSKKPNNGKRPRKDGNVNPPTRAQYEQLQKEFKELRDENRVLKRHLAALVFKDEPKNLDLRPEDGIAEPSLIELVAELRRSGK
jgi:hypothetical protein